MNKKRRETMQKEKEVLRESLDKLNMTKEVRLRRDLSSCLFLFLEQVCLQTNTGLRHKEINRFEKAFKDPKFQQMFEEYAKEISDPKARAESEAYLRQIESGNQTQNVYGSDVQLIVPEESFVVKTKKEGDEPVKVFINVCTSEKVQKAESKKTVQNGREGNTWSIPFSLGHERVSTSPSSVSPISSQAKQVTNPLILPLPHRPLPIKAGTMPLSSTSSYTPRRVRNVPFRLLRTWWLKRQLKTSKSQKATS